MAINFVSASILYSADPFHYKNSLSIHRPVLQADQLATRVDVGTPDTGQVLPCLHTLHTCMKSIRTHIHTYVH